MQDKDTSSAHPSPHDDTDTDADAASIMAAVSDTDYEDGESVALEDPPSNTVDQPDSPRIPSRVSICQPQQSAIAHWIKTEERRSLSKVPEGEVQAW